MLASTLCVLSMWESITKVEAVELENPIKNIGGLGAEFSGWNDKLNG